ncbi:MAG: Rid family hydrolase [Verrucomicrobiota bacterium]
MSIRRNAVWAVLILMLTGCSGDGGGEEAAEAISIEYFLQDKSTGIPVAVKVSGGVLVHTTQLFPVLDPKSSGSSTLQGQVDSLLNELEGILKEHGGGSVDQVVKLNVYVSAAGDCEKVEKLLVTWFAKHPMPALTLIVTPLARPGALVALDAVAVIVDSDTPKGVEMWSDLHAIKGRTFGGEALAAVSGHKTDLVYISGRASKADDLGEATQATMEQLISVLQMLGGNAESVVQVKVFLKPMHKAVFAAEAIQNFFEKMDRPPVVMVEWESSSYPTEIEVVAAIPNRRGEGNKVMYMTPPGDKPSPVYSKVVVVREHDLIYVGGGVGDPGEDAEDEVKTLYDRMGKAVEAAGGDFNHLVKATYYVSNPEVSKALNELRPKVYDAKRPPAASKVTLKEIGVADRGILIDMIAVPAIDE